MKSSVIPHFHPITMNTPNYKKYNELIRDLQHECFCYDGKCLYCLAIAAIKEYDKHYRDLCLSHLRLLDQSMGLMDDREEPCPRCGAGGKDGDV